MRNRIFNKEDHFFKVILLGGSWVVFFLAFSACSFRNVNKEDLHVQKDSFPAEKMISTTKCRFLNRRVNFGRVYNDTILYSKYYFVNTGDRKLIIDYVNPDCSCTGYSLSDDTVMVGDTAYIELMFNTEGKYGNQKVYTIVCVNTKHRLYKLTLLANVSRKEEYKKPF